MQASTKGRQEKLRTNPERFYNPIEKPRHRLLSRPEKLYGRFFPRLAKVSLFALSVGITGVMASPAEAAKSTAFFACAAAYFHRSNAKKFNDAAQKGENYDFTRQQDIQRFKDKYQNQYSLPERFIKLSEESGLARPPLFYVTSKESYAAIGRTNFMAPEARHAVRINRNVLKRESPAVITYVCGHEIGHAALGHSLHTESTMSLAAQAMHIKAALVIAASGNYIGGALYMASALTASFIAQAKQYQSYEHEADRHALVRTGVTVEIANMFEKEGSVPSKPAGALLNTAFAVASAQERLFSVHPSNDARATYIRRYEQVNAEAARKTRLSLGLF